MTDSGFGSVRAHSGADTEWTYTGEQNDPAGLEYLRARYYDPEIGRFLSRDPFPDFAFAPQSQNRYVYVLNNAVNWIDPWGLCDVEGSAFATPTPTHTPTPSPARRIWVCGPVTPAGCLNGHWDYLPDQGGGGWPGAVWEKVSDVVVSVATCEWCQSAAVGAGTATYCARRLEAHQMGLAAASALGNPEAGPFITVGACAVFGIAAGFGFNIFLP